MTVGSSCHGADALIVIPSLNEEAYIAGVIASLQADENCAEALIVLADGGSADRTVTIVQEIAKTDPRVKVIEAHGGLGTPAANVNRAVAALSEDRRWLIRVDAHAEYPPHYASRLMAIARETGAAAVVTTMTTRGSSCFQKAAAAAQNSFLGTGGSPHRTSRRSGWVDHGHHALMNLETFWAAGGYDESFSHNEDAELDTRIAVRGGRIWLTADLPIAYFPRSDGKALFRQYFRYGGGRAKTFVRHRKRNLRQLAPIAVAPAVLLALASPIAWPAGLPALIWLVAAFSCGLALARPGDWCAAAAGWPAMLMHLAWSLGYWSELFRGGRRPFEPALRRPSRPIADAATESG